MRCVTIELAICAAFFSFGSIGAVNAGTGDIRVSGRYFADETGKSWIPVGCNICFDRNAGGSANTRDLYDRWMPKFATNGGNYMRVWLSAPFVEVMPERAYEFSAEATDNLKWLVARAETLGIKLKFTFENFRRVGPRTDMDASKGIISFRNPVYAPYAKTMCDVFTLPKCFDIYLAKARYIAEAVGKSDTLVAVELWNEINSVGGFDHAVVGEWSERMLAELKKLFPGKMTLQNLGSFSAPRSYSVYDWMAGQKGNDFMQMHRYLDPGAEQDVCRGPMDVLCADAVRELLDRRPDCPAVLAEVGAVKANHTGPSDLYPNDAKGMLLHDEIFAPFFAGSAGSGQPWHWDHQYIDGNNLWWHFARFAEAVKGVNPVTERFRPFRTETRRLRVWGLRGERTTLLWCRDKANTWESELMRGESPATVSGEKIPFSGSLRCYLPWENRWVDVDGGILPDFSRSIIVRIAAPPVMAAAGVRKCVADVVIYGGSSAAVTAAVKVKDMGLVPIIVSPDKHIGGLSVSGLGFTDSGNTAAIGGLSREFYRRIYREYQKPEAWRWQRKEEFKAKGQDTKAICHADKTMWTFEPHVAERVFAEWLDEKGIVVRRGEFLDRESGVEKKDGRIVSIRTLSGNVYHGRYFIDATYEGDLMAAAGVPYSVGREDCTEFGEKWNGNQVGVLHHRHHFRDWKISAYKIPNDPTSGLCAEIGTSAPGERGRGDRLVQAYCYRLCMTDDPRNRIPFSRPEGYDPARYELLSRVYAHGYRETFWNFSRLANNKTDTNNHGPMSADYIGGSHEWPEASYARREELAKAHREYQMGLYYFIATDPSVPEEIRLGMSKWGLAKDEFIDNGGWPYSIYVREGRRMKGEYVMTEHDCLDEPRHPAQGRSYGPVGMGSYALDSHNVRRYVTPEGYVQNEGDIGVQPEHPYGIDYGSLVPRREDCRNLLVPVALSATHTAFGSIRMEPVFMVLGESAATASAIAAKDDRAVQDVSYADLAARLKADGQILLIDKKSAK